MKRSSSNVVVDSGPGKRSKQDVTTGTQLLVAFVHKNVLTPPPLVRLPVHTGHLVDQTYLSVQATTQRARLDSYNTTWHLLDDILGVAALTTLVVAYLDPPLDLGEYTHVGIDCTALPPDGLPIPGLSEMLAQAIVSEAPVTRLGREMSELYTRPHALGGLGEWPDEVRTSLHAEPLAWQRVAMQKLAPCLLRPPSTGVGNLQSVLFGGGRWQADLRAERVYPAGPSSTTSAGCVEWRGGLLHAGTGTGKTDVAVALGLRCTAEQSAVVRVPGSVRAFLPGTCVVVVPPHLLSQWGETLVRAAPGRVLVLENVRGLRRLESVAYLAQFRFVLVNATFLDSNSSAFHAEWDRVCRTLLAVRFRLRIVDEFTECVQVEAPAFRGDRIGVSRGAALVLLETLFPAAATLLVSATPFPVRSAWSRVLCMAVLLGASYNGRTLFAVVDECTATWSIGAGQPVRKGVIAFEDRAIVGSALVAMQQPYFAVPPSRQHVLSVHLLGVPPSEATCLCAMYGYRASVRGVMLSYTTGYQMPSAEAFRAFYEDIDHHGRYANPRFRQTVDRRVAEGRDDIRCLPATTHRPPPVAVLQTGPARYHLAMPCSGETPSCVADVWVAVHGILGTPGAATRALLFVHDRDLPMAQKMLGELAVEVLVLSGNSKALSSRIKRFKGGAHGVMVVPSSHCSGINLPMVTHIIIPYLPTTCSTADLRQLIGRVQRHGSRAHTRVVFVAEDMDRAAHEERALASITR